MEFELADGACALNIADNSTHVLFITCRHGIPACDTHSDNLSTNLGTRPGAIHVISIRELLTWRLVKSDPDGSNHQCTVSALKGISRCIALLYTCSLTNSIFWLKRGAWSSHWWGVPS